MNNTLIIDARFTEPPSSVSVFRDISLYATTFLDSTVLVECRREERDLYWYWLRNKGAFDYVKDFVDPNTETGILISYLRGHVSIVRLDADTLNFVTMELKRLLD
jgi:hypothetical protein